MYLYYNRIVGGLRMQQESYPMKECLGDKDMIDAAYGAPCYQGDYILEPELHAGCGSNKALLDREGAKSVILKKNLGQSEVRALLRQMEDDMWLSPNTQKVEFFFVTYNGELDLVTATFINFFFT